MRLEKRKLDGSKIKPDENYTGKTLDWDPDLGGPVVKVPHEAQPQNADQSVSKHRRNSGSAKARARSAKGDTASQSKQIAEPAESAAGGNAAK
jgi:hypothetical protein